MRETVATIAMTRGNPRNVFSLVLLSKNNFHDQHRHHADHHRPDDLRAVFDGEAGTDIVSENVAYGTRDRDHVEHISGKDIGEKRCVVGNDQRELRVSGGRADIVF